MRGGETLQGKEIYIGRSVADHPNWFPVFEHSMYWAVMIRCLMEPIPLSISIFIRSWVVKYSTDNPKRHKFSTACVPRGETVHTQLSICSSLFFKSSSSKWLVDWQIMSVPNSTGRLTFKGYVLWVDYPRKRCGQNSGLAHHHSSTIFTAHQRIN